MEELLRSFCALLFSFSLVHHFCQIRCWSYNIWLMFVDLLHLFCIFLVSCSGVGLSGADKELVPADHSLPHVHLIQPDVGFPYQGLLHELASIGHQEKLEIDWREKQLSHGLFICYLVVT